MKPIIYICLLFCFLLGITNHTFGQIKPKVTPQYKKYCNTKYNFCVDYHPQHLFPQGESDSKDGQKFIGKDKENELLVFKDYKDALLKPDSKEMYSLEDYYKELAQPLADKPNRKIVYKTLQKTYFVLSGTEIDRIFYQKTILKNGQMFTAILTYWQKDRAIFDQIAQQIFKSFQ